MKRKYRLLEVKDKLINNGKPYWVIQYKNIFGVWISNFGVHSEYGSIFYDKEEAEIWFNYHINKKSRITIKVIE